MRADPAQRININHYFCNMNFKLKFLSPLLFTKDLAQTILFYETILGFKAQSNFPNFVSLTKDDVNIMFVLPTREPEELKDPNHKKEFFSSPQLTGNIFILQTRLIRFGTQ